MITSPNDGDSPIEGNSDDVMPTEASAITDHEDTTTEATGREGTTTDHGENKAGYSETTTDHSETTLDQTLDNQAGKTQNQDSTDTTKRPLSLSTPHEQGIFVF